MAFVNWYADRLDESMQVVCSSWQRIAVGKAFIKWYHACREEEVSHRAIPGLLKSNAAVRSEVIARRQGLMFGQLTLNRFSIN